MPEIVSKPRSRQSVLRWLFLPVAILGGFALWFVAGSSDWPLRATWETGLDNINRAALSPDGTILAVVGNDFSKALVWDVRSERLLKTFETVDEECRFSFSRTGKRYAAVSLPEGIEVWDLSSLQLVRSFATKRNSIDCFSFSYDGKKLAVVGRGNSSHQPLRSSACRIWDVRSGEQLSQFVVPAAKSVALSPDGRWFATGGTNRIILVTDRSTGEIRRLTAGNTIYHLEFSPDGQKLVSAEKSGGMTVWNVSTWSKLAALQNPGNTYRAAFSTDGSTLTGMSHHRPSYWWENYPLLRGGFGALGFRTGSYGEVHAFDAETLGRRTKRRADLEGVWIWLFSSDGRKFVSNPTGGGRIEVRDVPW